MTREEKEIEVQAKAEELSKKKGITVHGFIIVASEENEVNDFIVAYCEEPKRATKLRAADKMIGGATSAGAMLVEACLLKEESDARILSDDTAYITLCNEMTGLIKVYSDVVKKN